MFTLRGRLPLTCAALILGVPGLARPDGYADRSCLFPKNWQVRLDTDDEGVAGRWFVFEPRGPWDDVPEDARERTRRLKDWRGIVWLRTTVRTRPEWRGRPIHVGLSRARWPDRVRLWWDGEACPAVREAAGPAPGSHPVALVTRTPAPAAKTDTHHLVVRMVYRGRDPFEPPSRAAGSSVILAAKPGDIAGWFEMARFRRAWLARRFPNWLWSKAMLADRLWLQHGNAPSPVHTGVVGDRHEPAMTHFGGVVIHDGDNPRTPHPLATIVPWVYDHRAKRLHSVEESGAAQWQLRDGRLPIPEMAWQAGPVRVAQTLYACRAGPAHEWVAAVLRIGLVNTGAGPADVSLYAAAYQRMDAPDAVGLETMRCDPAAGTIRANGRLLVLSDTPATDGGCVGHADGAVEMVDAYARRGTVPAPTDAGDARGMASGLLRFRCALEAGESRVVNLRMPVGYYFPLTKFKRYPPALATLKPEDIADTMPADRRLERVEQAWRRAVPVMLEIPDADIRNLFYASAANLLLGVDGDMIYPGPVAYSSQVFHDAGDEVAVLAMLGVTDPVDRIVKDLVLGHTARRGIPGPVGVNGHSGIMRRPVRHRPGRQDGLFLGWGEDAARAHGRIGAGALRACRLRRNLDLIRDIWPAIERAADAVVTSADLARRDALRGTPRFGLVDRSVLGFSRDVRYAGNWTCLAFLAEASRAARMVARPKAAERFGKAADRLRADLVSSLRLAMKEQGLTSLPVGADAQGRAIRGEPPFESAFVHAPALTACRPAGVAAPRDLLVASYRQYAALGTREGGWRCDGDRFFGSGCGPGAAMLMLGLRREAFRTLRFTATSQTGPGAISERDIRTDRAHRLYGRWCRGTGPVHLWAAALYCLQVRSMFLIEDGDRRLTLLAGVPAEWLKDGATVAFGNAPTHFGRVSVRCTSRIEAGRVEVAILPEADPPDGYTLHLPFIYPATRIRTDVGDPIKGASLIAGVHLPPGVRRIEVDFKKAD